VIQRQIEAQGVSTVCLSLYRPFTEAAKPPRALWVPFPFGRPLGAPNNKAIQRKVIHAALDLLRRERGPVLEELALAAEEDHLEARHQTAGKSCGPTGCNFNAALSSAGGEQSAPSVPPYDGDLDGVCAELRSLARHHATYLKQYGGRTQVGHSGIDSTMLPSAAQFVHRYVIKEDVELPSHAPARPNSDVQLRRNLFVRLCTDDLKAYCLESRLAEQGGSSENAADYNDWLWFRTKVGSLIAAARDRVIETTDRSKDPNWILARAMVPRGYGESGYIRATQNSEIERQPGPRQMQAERYHTPSCQSGVLEGSGGHEK
jgi:hypothetical protein